MKHLVFFLLLWGACAQLSAQSITGRWIMVDDKTGKPKSEIELYRKDGKLYGKVVRTLAESANHLCDKCTGYRKNKPMLGMVVIEDLTYKDGYWQDGKALFPKQGKWYPMDAWLAPNDPDTLVVRGYLGPLYRTQYWKRSL